MRAEFTVEPFVDGNPGPHVTAAIDAANEAGAEVSVGPFGSEISGDVEVVLRAIDSLVRAAVRAGATRVTVQVNA
ncbi:MAG: thiamine-binding protein [Actinomycetota bacterium]